MCLCFVFQKEDFKQKISRSLQVRKLWAGSVRLNLYNDILKNFILHIYITRFYTATFFITLI